MNAPPTLQGVWTDPNEQKKRLDMDLHLQVIASRNENRGDTELAHHLLLRGHGRRTGAQLVKMHRQAHRLQTCPCFREASSV